MDIYYINGVTCLCYVCMCVYSAVSAPSMKLMFVGLNGRGKTSLLSSLRGIGKERSRTITITIRERLDSQSLSNSSGMHILTI